MNQHGSRYSTSYQSTSRSSIHDRPSRPMPPTNTGSATALIRSFNSGSLNISTTNSNRTRLPNRFTQPSPERPIRINPTTTQRRLSSQDRSVCVN